MTSTVPRPDEEAKAAPLPFDVAATAEPRTRLPVASWTRRYVCQLVLTDALVAAIAVTIGWLIKFGVPNGTATYGYVAWGAAIIAAWLVCLHAADAYEIRRISTGTREHQRVLRASLNLAAFIAIAGYLTRIVIARTFLAVVIPLGLVLMIVARYLGRQSVHRRRRAGDWTSTILAVGTSESVRHLVEVTARNPETGLVVVGACVEDSPVGEQIMLGVPVVGDVGHVAELADQFGVDIVAVAGSGLGPRRIRELGWALEGTGRNMVMAPGLTEVAGPRVHVSPVENLPLMWVDQPQFTGLRLVIKRMLDLVGAGLVLALASPLLLLIALAVKASSRGPVFYRSLRMGKDGTAIRVVKFRSMYADAEERRETLLELNEFQGGMLFKIRRDPRVTSVGRVLRKFSLDELPQLCNVLGGSMSLVGPRPPFPSEVERYQAHAHRRLLVKPGMTGLWQVSGRSDLTWDESVRLDLYYVENWSLGLDLAIIARTVWAVLRSRGAY